MDGDAAKSKLTAERENSATLDRARASAIEVCRAVTLLESARSGVACDTFRVDLNMCTMSQRQLAALHNMLTRWSTQSESRCILPGCAEAAGREAGP